MDEVVDSEAWCNSDLSVLKVVAVDVRMMLLCEKEPVVTNAAYEAHADQPIDKCLDARTLAISFFELAIHWHG